MFGVVIQWLRSIGKSRAAKWAEKIERDNCATDRAEFQFSEDEWLHFESAVQEATGMSPVDIKLGKHPQFQQPTQKARILAALERVRSLDDTDSWW